MRKFATTALSVALLSAARCASQGSKNDESASRGMMCPKCETVWVSKVEGQGTKAQRLTSAKAMTCPDCDATAKAYLEGGSLILHDCPSCKVKPIEVTAGAPRTHEHGTHP